MTLDLRACDVCNKVFRPKAPCQPHCPDCQKKINSNRDREYRRERVQPVIPFGMDTCTAIGYDPRMMQADEYREFAGREMRLDVIKQDLKSGNLPAGLVLADEHTAARVTADRHGLERLYYKKLIEEFA